MIPAPNMRQKVCAWCHKESDLDDLDVGLYPEHWELLDTVFEGPGIKRYWLRQFDLEVPVSDLNDVIDHPGIAMTVEVDDQLFTIKWVKEPTGIYKVASLRYRDEVIEKRSEETPGYGGWA